MNHVTLFYLENCPYCIKARKALAELTEEMPSYREVKIDWVEESLAPDVAGAYDYYYVPALFSGEKKLYEADPSADYEAIKAGIRQALNDVLA